jgi:hypothetical protein
MRARILLNGESLSYLVHGQPFSLEIEGEGCLFLIIFHDIGGSVFSGWHIRSRKTVFKSITNAYKPHIRVWGVGLGIKKIFEKKLHINFMNVISQDVQPEIPDFSVNLNSDLTRPQIAIGSNSVSLNGNKAHFNFPNSLHMPFMECKLVMSDDSEIFNSAQAEGS